MSTEAPERTRDQRREIVAPNRSYVQRIVALEHANAVRSERARLKRDLKGGRRDFVALLMDPPEFLLTAKVSRILLEVPKYGRVTVDRAFRRAGVSPSKTFGGITDRERRMLLAELRIDHPAVPHRREPVTCRRVPGGWEVWR